MQTQNLLIGAMTYLLKFQKTHCPSARERALMMFEALGVLKSDDPTIEALCDEANTLLAT
jgi:hypothetical protein